MLLLLMMISYQESLEVMLSTCHIRACPAYDIHTYSVRHIHTYFAYHSHKKLLKIITIQHKDNTQEKLAFFEVPFSIVYNNSTKMSENTLTKTEIKDQQNVGSVLKVT